MRQGKSVDVFSFGLVLFYCLTGGKHAFGESYERDFNIMQVPITSLRFIQTEFRALFPRTLLLSDASVPEDARSGVISGMPCFFSIVHVGHP